METDVKLEADKVLIEGIIKVQGTDLMLDSPDRRSNDTPFRRALVHGFGDKLTINYGNDYPGGVQILGTIQAMQDVKVLRGIDITQNLKVLGNIEVRGYLQGSDEIRSRTLYIDDNAFVKSIEVNHMKAESTTIDKLTINEWIQTTDIGAKKVITDIVKTDNIDITGDINFTKSQLSRGSVSLIQTIKSLTLKINELEERLSKLENKS